LREAEKEDAKIKEAWTKRNLQKYLKEE